MRKKKQNSTVSLLTRETFAPCQSRRDTLYKQYAHRCNIMCRIGMCVFMYCARKGWNGERASMYYWHCLPGGFIRFSFFFFFFNRLVVSAARYIERWWRLRFIHADISETSMNNKYTAAYETFSKVLNMNITVTEWTKKQKFIPPPETERFAK